MKIDFSNDKHGFQQAKILRSILTENYNKLSVPENQLLIDNLLQQINSFLSNQDENDTANSVTFYNYFSSLWHFLSGPSQRELELSKQRRELIERAEHAEASAFEALAETSDLRKEYEQALHKIRALEQELSKAHAR